MRQNRPFELSKQPRLLGQQNPNIQTSFKTGPSKMESLLEDSEASKWQNIPDVIQRAIGTLLENQNRLTDKLGELEQQSQEQKSRLQEAETRAEEKAKRVVAGLEEEVRSLKEQLKLASLDGQEQLNFKLRKFVLNSELEQKMRGVKERVDKVAEIVRGRVDHDEFQKALEKLERSQVETRRQLQNKADQLDLGSQKDDLEHLLSVQIQKIGKLVADNSIKILRNSKDLMKKVGEKKMQRELSGKLEAVGVTRATWKESLPLWGRRSARTSFEESKMT